VEVAARLGCGGKDEGGAWPTTYHSSVAAARSEKGCGTCFL
jgi:hypothetical protein